MQSSTAKELSTVVAKPILKWAGGKTQMLSELLPKVPPSAPSSRTKARSAS